MAKDLKQRPKKVMPISKGRPKGTPNKTTALLKDAILKAAEFAGKKLGKEGDDGLTSYLIEQAEKEPVAFMSLLGKVLPLQVSGDKDNPLQINVTIGGDDNS